jgi:hypothetical protein
MDRINNKGAGMVELLIGVIIIGIVIFFSMKMFAPKPALDKQTQQAMKEQGVENSYTGAIDAAKRNTKAFNQSTRDNIPATPEGQ